MAGNRKAQSVRDDESSAPGRGAAAGKQGGSPDGGQGGSEPGLIARVVAEYYSTVVVVGLVAAAVVGWTILTKVRGELPVPGALYRYLAGALGLVAVSTVVRLVLGAAVDQVNRRQNALKEARFLVKEAERCLGAYGKRLSVEARTLVEQAQSGLEAARLSGQLTAIEAQSAHLDGLLDQHFASQRKSTTREYAESIVVAVLIALFLRSFVVEAFKIPSGSMIPTLLVGDHIFVNKFIYGVRVPWTDIKFGMSVRVPERGEVIVFKYPKEPEKDFIKRIVAVAGDTVEVKDNVVYVNGTPVPREHVGEARCEYEDYDEGSGHWERRRCDAWRETVAGHSYTTYFDRGGFPRSWPKFTVPAESVYVMGDNRDNSHDSRYWGAVPYDLIKGKAMIIWFSSGEPQGLRLDRFFTLIH